MTRAASPRAGKHLSVRPTKAPTKSRAPKKLVDDNDDAAEDKIIGWSLDGSLAKAFRKMTERQLRSGIPVTAMRGDKVVKKLPNGKEEVIAVIKRRRHKAGLGIGVLRGK